jgi:nucleotide-binding universal stress UspA family protein
MFKKILWVTDFSQPARDAGQQALHCAQCSNGEVIALTVVDAEDLPYILDDVPDPFVKSEELDQLNRRLEAEYEERVMNHLKKEVEAIGADPSKVKTLLRVGTPWKEIVAAADELGANLITIGARGKRGLEDLLLGSTVERVTHHAHCPVLVVR